MCFYEGWFQTSFVNVSDELHQCIAIPIGAWRSVYRVQAALSDCEKASIISPTGEIPGHLNHFGLIRVMQAPLTRGAYDQRLCNSRSFLKALL